MAETIQAIDWGEADPFVALRSFTEDRIARAFGIPVRFLGMDAVQRQRLNFRIRHRSRRFSKSKGWRRYR